MTSETHETRHYQSQAPYRGRALPLSRERCWVPTQMGELHPDFYRLGDHLAGEPQCRWLVNAQNKDYHGLSRKLIEKAIYLVPGTEIKREEGEENNLYGNVLSPAWWHRRIPEWKAEQGPPKDPGNPFTRAAASELSSL